MIHFNNAHALHQGCINNPYYMFRRDRCEHSTGFGRHLQFRISRWIFFLGDYPGLATGRENISQACKCLGGPWCARSFFSHKGEVVCIGGGQKKNDKKQKLCLPWDQIPSRIPSSTSTAARVQCGVRFHCICSLNCFCLFISFFRENISLRDIRKSKGRFEV